MAGNPIKRRLREKEDEEEEEEKLQPNNNGLCVCSYSSTQRDIALPNLLIPPAASFFFFINGRPFQRNHSAPAAALQNDIHGHPVLMKISRQAL